MEPMQPAGPGAMLGPALAETQGLQLGKRDDAMLAAGEFRNLDVHWMALTFPTKYVGKVNAAPNGVRVGGHGAIMG